MMVRLWSYRTESSDYMPSSNMEECLCVPVCYHHPASDFWLWSKFLSWTSPRHIDNRHLPCNRNWISFNMMKALFIWVSFRSVGNASEIVSEGRALTFCKFQKGYGESNWPGDFGRHLNWRRPIHCSAMLIKQIDDKRPTTLPQESHCKLQPNKIVTIIPMAVLNALSFTFNTAMQYQCFPISNTVARLLNVCLFVCSRQPVPISMHTMIST